MVSMETTELIAMIREGARGADPSDTIIFPETGKIICVAELLEVADRLEYLDGLVNEWEAVVHGQTSGDLISRSALLNELSKKLSIVDMIGVAEIVESIPAVEAEPVVRCGDCADWYRHLEVNLEWGDCIRYNVTKHESGYCNRGKRRTEDV